MVLQSLWSDLRLLQTSCVCRVSLCTVLRAVFWGGRTKVEAHGCGGKLARELRWRRDEDDRSCEHDMCKDRTMCLHSIHILRATVRGAHAVAVPTGQDRIHLRRRYLPPYRLTPMTEVDL